ncbi:hypothetical protein ACIQTT_11340 [Microbacterium sp. NPDC090225]|uniref:hypothetical protein n=1 Tax=Microbacterium sp. NPDC090225 TaxID=3364207 RepID=UPI00381CA389
MSSLIRQAIHSAYGHVDDEGETRRALAATFGAVTSDKSGEQLVDGIRSGRRLAALS